MYCHNCGQKVIGKFCSHCGTQVAGGELPTPSPPSGDWKTEKRFDFLPKHSDVRKMIAQFAEQSSQKISADEYLKLADLAFGSLMGGVSASKLGSVLVPIYQKTGISTGKSQTRNLRPTIQELIVKSLCALAKNGFPIESSEAAADGIVFTAKVPSDLWSWEGRLVLSIQDNDDFREVKIAVKIKGQLYDWGKSKKIIAKVFRDIETIAIPF